MKKCSHCKQIKDESEFHKSDTRCISCNVIHQREMNYKKYGITIDDYNRMYEEQKGECSICHRSYDILCVDHNHKTGKVRSLLCRNCNIFLGTIKDSVKTAEFIVEYLKS